MLDSVKSHHIAILSVLRLSRLFGGINEEELIRIAQHCRAKTLEKGQRLFREGEPSQGFYLIHSGAVCLYRLDGKGRECVLQVFREGESFAEATLCSLENYPASAKALEYTHVILVERLGFVDLLRTQPYIALWLLESMSIRMHALIRSLADIKSKDAETRLAHWLLQAGTGLTKGYNVELGMPKHILASKLGLTAETLSRALARLCERRLLRLDGKTVMVMDPVGLKSGFEYA